MGRTATSFHSQLCSGFSMQTSPSDNLMPLCNVAITVMHIDLMCRPSVLPAREDLITLENAGTLTAVAFWYEPDFGQLNDVHTVHPNAMVCFLKRPRAVSKGDSVKFSIQFVDCQLQLSLLENETGN